MVAVLGFSIESSAQDPNFSQYFNNPLYSNPAYSGLTKGLKARMNYRRQWVKIPGDFDNYNFSMDIADRDIPGAGGLGFILNSDKRGIGYIKTLTVGIAPSVRIPLASNFIMQAAPLISYVRKEINWDDLIFSGQLHDIQGNVNPSTFTPPLENSLSYPDFSFGLLFQVHGDNTTATFGGAAHHITRPNQSFFEQNALMQRRYVGHGDIIFDIGDYKGYFKRKVSFKLNPGVIYQYQATMSLYSIGMNLYVTNLYFGMWYRNETLEYDVYSDLVLLAGVLIPFGEQSRLKMMYSYDMQINAAQAFTGPSHEISLVFEFDKLKLINSNNRFNRFRGREIIEETLECSPF